MDWHYIGLAFCILVIAFAVYLRVTLYFDDRWWNSLSPEDRAAIEAELDND